MAYGGYAALQRYKMKGLYQRIKKMGRRVRAANAIKRVLAATPSGVNGSARMTAYGTDWAGATDMQKNMRRATAFYGPGDYKSFFNSFIPRGTFAYGGRTLGGMTGIPGMGAVGSFLGNKLSNYVGFGDYNPQGCDAVGSVNQIAGGGPPISVNATHDMSGDIIFQRTEFVGNVKCSTGVGQTITPFQQTGYDLNPGWSSTFPWLSQIASNFELYDWEGLMFKYRPTSGEFGASAVSNALGKIVMATKYGINQTTPFSSTIEAQNYDYANSTKPSLEMVHGVETKNSSQVGGDMLVIRDSPIPNNTNVVLFDVGKLYVMTEGIPLAASTEAIIGELWVTYSLRLSRAKLWQSIGNDLAWAKVEFNGTAGGNFFTSVARNDYSGDFVVTLTNINSGTCTVSIKPVSSNTLQYTSYLVYAFGRSVANSTTKWAPFGILNNCSASTANFSGFFPSGFIAPIGTTSVSDNTSFSIFNFLTVTNPNNNASFALGTIAAPTSDIIVELIVIGIDSALPGPFAGLAYPNA